MDSVKLIYCDYLANLIKDNMTFNDIYGHIDYISGVEFDLDKRGVMKSTKKTIYVNDKYGQTYKIIIMESNDD